MPGASDQIDIEYTIVERSTGNLLAGLGYTRTSPITDEKRAPYCMMGVCFECLMVIDGMAHDLPPGLLPKLVEAIASHCSQLQTR